MNIADFHVATIRNGQTDEHRSNDAMSSVSYDQATHYYGLEGLFTEDEFKSFVAEAWDVELKDVDITVWEPGVFRVNL